MPLELYEEFRKPLKGATRQAAGDTDGPQFVENFDMDAAIIRYQQLITELPPLNRQLMLYILDLLAVFAAKSDINRMNSQNLAAIFQPGMLSHPAHAMAPEEYRLNQCVIIFLIENQDHFLIGMQGTAADERTVQEVQKGTPTVNAPGTPKYQSGVNRTASNASAGAESVSKEGMIRRNKSTSSRRSLASNGAPSPGSPALTSTPTGGLGRSNTLPSKRSPRVPPGRFAHRHDASNSPVGPLTPVHPPSVPEITPPTPTVLPPAPSVVYEVATPPEDSSVPSIPTSTAPSSLLPSHSIQPARSQEKLVEPHAEAITPSKERRIPNIPNIFQRAPSGENNELRQPNKLRKKMPGTGGHYSAHSSTVSLPRSAAASPAIEASNPMETIPPLPGNLNTTASSGQPAPSPSDSTPRASQAPSAPSTMLHPNNLTEMQPKPRESPPTSVTSYNDMSDPDQLESQTTASLASPEVASPDREKRRRWRLSRKKEDSISLNSPPNFSQPLISPRMLGSNSQAEGSNSSVGSSGYFHNHRPRASMSGDVSDAGMMSSLDDRSMMSDGTREGRDRDRDRDWDKSSEYRKSNIADWLKNKYREHRETAEQRRNKSPPAHDGRSASIGERIRKSIDTKRDMNNGSEKGYSDEHIPMPPPPMREPGPGHSQSSIQSSPQTFQQAQPQPVQAQQPPGLYQNEKAVEVHPVAQTLPAQVQPSVQSEQPQLQQSQPHQSSVHQSQHQEPLPQIPEQPSDGSVPTQATIPTQTPMPTPSRHMDLDE